MDYIIPIHIKTHIYELYDVYYTENNSNKNIKVKNGFRSILHLYYPWATKHELNKMYDLIIPIKQKNDRKIWSTDIYNTYNKEITTLFGKIDSNNNGEIDLNEFKIAVKMSIVLDNKIILQMFKDADTNNNGTIDITEFITFISNNPILRKNFVKILLTTAQKNKNIHQKKLAVIFKNVPNSPNRINWKPSLTDLNSPNTVGKKFTF